jgi:hypothetical protein
MKPFKMMYPELLKRCLTNWIYGDRELLPLLKFGNYQLVKDIPMDKNLRMNGGDWPPTAHTMIGIKRLNNLQYCIEQIIEDDIPGDLIECGVWRGGATILMRGLLKYYGIDKTVFVADSFEGLPEPDEKYPADARDKHYIFSELSVSLEEVKKNFVRYNLLDEQVVFIRGWFKDTLPTAPINKLALLRIDCDMYGSTRDVLVNLYPKVSSGGYVIIDDYQILEPCKKAVDDYRTENNICEPIIKIDGSGIFWRRI